MTERQQKKFVKLATKVLGKWGFSVSFTNPKGETFNIVSPNFKDKEELLESLKRTIEMLS